MGGHLLDIACSSCGEINRLPAVHCKRCGAKLDMAVSERHLQNVSSGIFQISWSSTWRLALLVLLALLLFLAVWPARLPREVGEAVDARRYRLKGELMLVALERGLPASQTMEEREINAHFREVVAAQPPRKGWSPRVEEIGVRLFPGRAEVFLAVRRGPLTLTGTFQVRVKDSRLIITRARAGHLPLPGFLGRLYARLNGGILRQLKNENRILRHLEGAVIQAGSIELLVKPES